MNDEMMFGAQPECPVIYQDGVYDIFLDEEIRSPSYYRNAFQSLRTATENETVRLLISTPGGNLTSAIMFKNLIESCEADVIGVLEGEAYSAGSMILLSCPNIMVQPNTSLMCHSASFGSGGMVQQVRDHVDFTSRHAETVMEEVYKDFLSPQEFQDLKRGVEIWMDAEQVNKRLEKLFEIREARFAEEFGEMEDAPSLVDMIKQAVSEGIKQHEAEKAKKEAKAKKAAERKPTPKLEKALEQAKEIRENFEKVVDTPESNT